MSGKRDEVYVIPSRIKRTHIPDDYPFDKQGNPKYPFYSTQKFSEMTEKDLDFWVREISKNIRLKWSEAQKESG